MRNTSPKPLRIITDVPHSNGNGKTIFMAVTKEEAEALQMLRQHPDFGSAKDIVLLGQLTAWSQIPDSTPSKPLHAVSTL